MHDEALRPRRENEALRVCAGISFLQKPITLDALARNIRELLDGPLRPIG